MRLLLSFSLLFSSALFSSPLSSIVDDVQDIEKMVRRVDGLYEVTCRNGVTEIVTVEQIRNGLVCGGSTQTKKIICTGSASIIFPTRASDGQILGSSMDAKSCRAVAEAAFQDVVCTTTGNRFWWVTRIVDGKRIGTHTDFSSCVQVSSYMRELTACIPFANSQWKPVRVYDEKWLGANTTDLNQCLTSTVSAHELVVCANFGFDQWSLVHVIDGERLGFFTDLTSCTLATQRAYGGKVCVPQGGNRWSLTRIADKQVLGGTVPLDACITQRIFEEEKTYCSVTQNCPSGMKVSCATYGSGATCDLGPNYVQCKYYDEQGLLQIDTKYCH